MICLGYRRTKLVLTSQYWREWHGIINHLVIHESPVIQSALYLLQSFHKATKICDTMDSGNGWLLTRDPCGTVENSLIASEQDINPQIELPDGTKPLPVDLSSVWSSGNHLSTILQEMPQPSVTEISLKIIYLKFCSILPGTNELMTLFRGSHVAALHSMSVIIKARQLSYIQMVFDVRGTSKTNTALTNGARCGTTS